MRLRGLIVVSAVASQTLAAAVPSEAEGLADSTRSGGILYDAPVIHGTRGTVLHLEYMPDQTYPVSIAVGSIAQIDFPAGEHVEHVVVSADSAVHAQQAGDTVQVSATRADAISGVNILTTRGTYRMQIASTHDSTQSTGFVHFGIPGAEQ